MGDVIIRIGEGAATVLAFLGASVLIVAVVAIFFPILAIVVGLCLCGPVGAPLVALMTSCGIASGSKERSRLTVVLHLLFSITVVIAVLWVLYLLPPP